MTEKLRVLFVTSTLGFGGAAKMLTLVSNELYRRGHKIGIINLHRTYADEAFRQIDSGITIYDIASKGIGHLSTIKKIVEISRAFKAQALIGFTEYPNLYAKIAGDILRIPSIMSERGDPVRNGMGIGLKNKISLAIINSSKGGVFQTDGAKEFYSKRLQKRSIVIANPISINESLTFAPIQEREESIVSVGRLDNIQKRYDIMIEAFRIFSSSHPNYILKLYGTGQDAEKIKSFANEMNVGEKVVFMGLTSEPLKEMIKSKIFIITSDYEGISNSLLEAMAVGMPCVATDHDPGGARLLINNRENGILVPVRDTEQIAKALAEFADDLDLAKRCGENAQKVTKRFSVSKIIDRWEKYIGIIINKYR